MYLKHGHHKKKPSPTYVSWQHMKARCDDVNHHAYADYGGRGISYALGWSSFIRFLADMGKRPKGMTLDRKDTDGHYTPNNCRWATRKQQAQNRRRAKPKKLRPEDLPKIRQLLKAGLTGRCVAKQFGVTPARISQVKYGR